MFSDFPNLHPLVVHLPIVLILLAAALQGLLVYRDWPPVRWITLGIMAGGFAGALAASTVFHAAAAGLSPRAAAVYAAHEQYASYTLWLSGITLLLAGVGRYFKIERRSYEVLVLVVAVAAAAALSVTGHRGAQLVYVEGVGPKGNLLDKSHGHGGEEEMPGMDTDAPGADAHDEAEPPIEKGHGQEPGHNDDGHDEAAKPANGQAPSMEGMDMSRTAPAQDNAVNASDAMGNMQMPNSQRGRSTRPAAQAGGMQDMPGMNMPAAKKQSSMPEGMDMSGMSTQRSSTPAPSRRAQTAPMNMDNMSGMNMGNMPGMDMRPARSKNAPRPQPASGNMGAMKGMDMGNMPGMQPAGRQKPAPNRRATTDMSGMPGMKKDESMPGMGNMKGMDMKGAGTMPGMAMPSPMDKYRFEDNNPARTQPQRNN